MPEPGSLGRCVVVGPGDEAPGPWRGCPRITVGAIEGETADELGACWRMRRAVVIELTPGLGLDDPDVAAGRRRSRACSRGSGRSISTSWASGCTTPSGPTPSTPGPRRPTGSDGQRSPVALGAPAGGGGRGRRRSCRRAAGHLRRWTTRRLPGQRAWASPSSTGSRSSTGRCDLSVRNDPAGDDLAADQLAAVAYARGGGPGDRPGRIGQDAGAHRTGPAAAQRVGPAHRRRSPWWPTTCGRPTR